MNNYVICAAALVVAIIVSGWYAVSIPSPAPQQLITGQEAKQQESAGLGAENANPVSAPAQVPSDWVKRNDMSGYSFSYPPTWTTVNYPVPSHAVWQFSVAKYSSSRTYTFPQTEPQQNVVKIAVYPFTRLKQYIDPSAWVEYDFVNKQWISGQCADFDALTGCEESKEIKKTVVASNAVVGGVESYVIKDQIPTYYLVPFNKKYSIIISMTEPPDISTTSQQILDSFRFSEFKDSNPPPRSSFESPSGKYAVSYLTNSRELFEIIDVAADAVLASYKPPVGDAIICEMLCYPFAKWLSDTLLLIGSARINSTNGADLTFHGAVVFDTSTKSYRPATQTEIDYFELYHDSTLFEPL